MKKSVAASEKPVKAKEFDKELFKRSVEYNVRTLYRKNLEEADAQQIFQAVSYAIKDRIVENWMETQKAYEKEDPKMVYYMSMEFLMGRALGNNLINLKAYKPVAEALEELGLDLNLIEDQEPDAALGNGGLGRLAACFLDSLATLGYPAYGCGIRYRYGMFKQEIRDGYQVEVPDNWLMNGNPFELRRPEYAKIVKFGGYVSVHTDENGRNVFTQEGYQSVKAIPFDFPIVGYGNGIVNTLRIWDAEPVECFQLDSFDKGDYQKAVEQENLARNIVEVLYPNDNHYAGKELRLKQQYFFISASVQEAVNMVMEAFDIADQYLLPVIILADGLIGQMMEPVEFNYVPRPNLPEKTWALVGHYGAERSNIKNLVIEPDECEAWNHDHFKVYDEVVKNEQAWEEYKMDDAEYAFVSYGTASRVVRTAIGYLRAEGYKVGMIRPKTLWPFPQKAFDKFNDKIKKFLDVEMSMGQMVPDVAYACNDRNKVAFHGRTGGNVPTVDEIVEFGKEVMGGDK